MLSKIVTASVSGMDIEKVTVEVDFSQGLPNLSLVGLPDLMVRESKERIRSAIINSGYSFPLKRITINLSPADTKKTGSHFDLPMAVGILESMGMLSHKMTENAAFLGELSLDGTVNSVESCLALVLGLKEHGVRNVYLPLNNTKELACLNDMNIYGVESFIKLADHLMEIETLKPFDTIKSRNFHSSGHIGEYECHDMLDYSDVLGQESGKRAMQISAAGWHDVMMVGPPGGGKSMLAKRLTGLMLEPTKEEQVEITKIHSIAGEKIPETDMTIRRPFRSPHHSATSTALMGGGYNSKPGELSLAHRGILFLDELPEFERRVLDMLRQPLEDEYINLTRLAARHRYPCSFILVTAMNPCPCGYYGDARRECTCNTIQRTRYSQKISGPLKDRMDIYIKINSVDFKEIVKNNTKSMSTAELKSGVITAADTQKKRYEGEDFSYNSQIPDNMVSEYCKIDKAGNEFLNAIYMNRDLSARAVGRIKRVARTIADIDGSDTVTDIHLAEAFGYRPPQSGDLMN